MKPDIGAEIMEERLSWAKEIMERITKINFENMPIELQVKTIEVGISLYIQKERTHTERFK
jgi:hypothetical protein